MLIDFTIKDVAKTIEALIATRAWKATKFFSEKSIVRATRQAYNGKFSPGNIEIILTIGKPNFAEREFIKRCKKAGEPFPVKKIVLKFPPEPKKKK